MFGRTETVETQASVVSAMAIIIASGSYPHTMNYMSDDLLKRSLVLAEMVAEQLRAESRYRASGHREGVLS